MQIINIENIEQAKEQLEKIGCQDKGVEIMAPKMIFKVIKLEDVKPKAAHIIKQHMLSVGGEAAVSKKAWNLEEESTDILVSGTLKQFKIFCEKTKDQPFGVPEIGQKIKDLLKL